MEVEKMSEDSLNKMLEEIKKNPELLLNKYLRAEKLVLREDGDVSTKGPAYRIYKDIVVLFTEGMAAFIDDDGQLHQVNPDAVQEIVYSKEASLWLKHLMLFSASQMVNQLMISKKYENGQRVDTQ
jgi:hypothetical protein